MSLLDSWLSNGRERVIHGTLTETYDDLGLYIERVGYVADENWTGSRDGDPAGLAQDDTHDPIFGDETDDIESANLLICTASGRYDNPDREARRQAVESLLDSVFGSQHEWHDNYCQTHGWKI